MSKIVFGIISSYYLITVFLNFTVWPKTFVEIYKYDKVFLLQAQD